MTYAEVFPSRRPSGDIDSVFRKIGLMTVVRDLRLQANSPVDAALNRFQRKLADVSMYLPQGFSSGLSQQFANILNDDVWDDDDQVPSGQSLDTFIQVLLSISPRTRPGVGTNGTGSVTAFWDHPAGQLTIDCLPGLDVRVIFSRTTQQFGTERGAFKCKANRIMNHLTPIDPGIWFD